MGWIAAWPPALMVAMLVLYRRRASAPPRAPLVAVALLIYAAGTALIGSTLVATAVDLARGASLFGLPFVAVGALATWWLTAGFATRCGLPPRALLRMVAHMPPDRD
jgi:hypothetical protein